MNNKKIHTVIRIIDKTGSSAQSCEQSCTRVAYQPCTMVLLEPSSRVAYDPFVRVAHTPCTDCKRIVIQWQTNAAKIAGKLTLLMCKYKVLKLRIFQGIFAIAQKTKETRNKLLHFLAIVIKE